MCWVLRATAENPILHVNHIVSRIDYERTREGTAVRGGGGASMRC